MTPPHQTQVTFPSGHQARVLYVGQQVPASEIVTALALPTPRAVVVLNGGTAELEPQMQNRLALILGDGLARVAAEEALTLVTGATNAGIFKLLGAGFERWPPTAPCIGVTVAQLVSLPGDPRSKSEQLEAHHTHVVLVDGAQWGDETATMYALFEALAQHCPSVSIFGGGGEIVLREMAANVAQRRRMILLAGSGRSTDAVLAAQRRGVAGDERISTIAQHGSILPFGLDAGAAAFRAMLRGVLFSTSSHEDASR